MIRDILSQPLAVIELYRVLLFYTRILFPENCYWHKGLNWNWMISLSDTVRYATLVSADTKSPGVSVKNLICASRVYGQIIACW